MNFLSNKYLLIAFRIIVGGVFVYASLNKLMDQEEFAKAIYNYKFLPSALINIFAIVLPYVELIAGLFLIAGIYVRGSSFLILLMLIIFIIALAQAYLRGLDMNCACFSLENPEQKSDIFTRIIEDILLLAATIIIYIKSKTILTKEKLT